MAKNRIGLGVVPAGIAFVGTVAVAARYRREMRAARERVDRLGSEVIQTDCGPIEYAQIGEGYPEPRAGGGGEIRTGSDVASQRAGGCVPF
jgi:hypothetical protein